jgi:hypothetical protein
MHGRSALESGVVGAACQLAPQLYRLRGEAFNVPNVWQLLNGANASFISTSRLKRREREMKAVVYFQNKQKGIVLNKTNAKKIIEISGSALTEEWHGTQIKIYPTETEFGGETVDCIRIKPVGKSVMSRMTPAPPPVLPKTEDHSAPLTDDDIPF